MSQPIRVLILEDSVTDAELEVRGLRHAGGRLASHSRREREP